MFLTSYSWPANSQNMPSTLSCYIVFFYAKLMLFMFLVVIVGFYSPEPSMLYSNRNNQFISYCSYHVKVKEKSAVTSFISAHMITIVSSLLLSSIVTSLFVGNKLFPNLSHRFFKWFHTVQMGWTDLSDSRQETW